jgi:hypothetical protein
MFALPLNILNNGTLRLEPTERHSSGFRCFGQVRLDEDRLWRLIRGSKSRRQRLMAHIQADQSSVQLRTGLRNELHALLGSLGAEENRGRDVVLVPSSNSLSFFPDQVCLGGGEMAQFNARATREGHHKVGIRALTDGGRGAILNIKFKLPLVEPTVYA